MKDFRDKAIVITGADAGPGRAFAFQLCRAGALLALCDLDLAGLEKTFQTCGDEGESNDLPGASLRSGMQAD